MTIFTHAQLVNTFFPKNGQLWDAHNAAPADKGGVYVFSTYPGQLQDNDYSYFGKPTGIDNQDYQTALDLISEGRKLVLYVGRSESRSLQERLADYANGGGHPVLQRLIQNPDVNIYCRWAEWVHFETAMIKRLGPQFNVRNVRTSLEMPSLGAFRWEGRTTWQDFKNNWPYHKQRMEDVPGIYVFTDDKANQNLNSSGGQVHYVGEALDLSTRFSDYVAGRKMNAGLAAQIQSLGAGNVYIRWTRNFQFEAEIIKALDAWLNVRGA